MFFRTSANNLFLIKTIYHQLLIETKEKQYTKPDEQLLYNKYSKEIQRLVNRRRTGKKPVIAVHITKDEDYEHLEKSMLLPDLRFFGRCSDIFTESIIINETMDNMARKMNALYNSLSNIEPADNWRDLDVFTKESNRSAASNMAAKLQFLNLEMKGKSGDCNRSAVNLS